MAYNSSSTTADGVLADISWAAGGGIHNEYLALKIQQQGESHHREAC